MAISDAFDLMWFAVIGAAFLWALYAAHTRENCAETPGLDARPGAADEIPRAEILTQVMKPIDR